MMKKQKIYSDLIDEQLELSSELSFGKLTKLAKYDVKKFEFHIDNEILAQKLGKEMGHYTTINCSQLFVHLKKVQDYISDCLSETISKFLSRASKKKKPLVLVVGLGNNSIVADSLGTKVTEKLVSTTQMPKELCKEMGKLCFLNAGVGGQTGITSFDIIESITKKLKPDVLIVVDALTTKDFKRLGCSFQVSDSGITPGAGVKNYLKTLNKQTLGCEVIAVGVPVMITGFGLCENIKSNLKNKVFTPKEVDIYTDKCSYVLAKAINKSVHKNGYTNYY